MRTGHARFHNTYRIRPLWAFAHQPFVLSGIGGLSCPLWWVYQSFPLRTICALLSAFPHGGGIAIVCRILWQKCVQSRIQVEWTDTCFARESCPQVSFLRIGCSRYLLPKPLSPPVDSLLR